MTQITETFVNHRKERMTTPQSQLMTPELIAIVIINYTIDAKHSTKIRLKRDI